jgi:hypothetical protein
MSELVESQESPQVRIAASARLAALMGDDAPTRSHVITQQIPASVDAWLGAHYDALSESERAQLSGVTEAKQIAQTANDPRGTPNANSDNVVGGARNFAENSDTQTHEDGGGI